MQPATVGPENGQAALQQQRHDPEQLPEGSREKLHRRWYAAFIHIADRKRFPGKEHRRQAHQHRPAQIARQGIPARRHGWQG